ncbi:MAG: DUF5985 family protein [Bacteriovoracia bacterium]
MIASIVYLLCALTSVGCAWLLYSNFNEKKSKLLFWSATCFLGLAVSNVGLFVDLVMAKGHDLFLLRTIPALVGAYLLIWGLIREST